MTLDEAIKYCEEVAKDMTNVDESELDLMYCGDTECINEHMDRCIKYADEHKQLAEWLKDYKRLKEQEPCEDCISRKAVLGMAKSYNTDGWDSYTPLVVDAEDIEELPPVTPQEPKTDNIAIPEGATNGEVMMAIFEEIQYYSDGRIDANWWNAPYKSEVRE